MDYNFHTHTYRCGHATGTEREYIEAAIAAGIKEMGFSDHAPWIDPALGREWNYVVPYGKVDGYISTVRALREEYQHRLTLHIGFEAEYDPADPCELIRFGAEYLVLGQHFVKTPKGEYTYIATGGKDELLPVYVDAIIRGMHSGFYTYVAHPDVFRYDGDTLSYQKEMRRLCEASSDTGVPLELNFLGIREGRFYPTEAMWEVAGDTGCPVTFGFDAHAPAAAADLATLPLAMALVEKYHLNYIGKPKLILLKKSML